MRGVALCITLTVRLAAQQASFDGTAVDSISHQPLAGVHIRLSIFRPDTLPIAYGAMSNAAGRFSIAAISPGIYTLSAERTGSIYLGAKTIALKPGQNLTDFKLEMTPRAIISGRVLDENGDPLDGVQVVGDSVGGSPSPDSSFSVNADDRGEFRAGVAPGKYNVKAVAPAGSGLFGEQAPEVRVNDVPESVYVTTWFPQSASADRATVVETAAGRETSGIDIHLTRQRSFKISGAVKGMPDGLTVRVIASSGDFPFYFRETGPDRKFTFSGLSPRAYQFVAIAEDNHFRSRPVQVNLNATDLTNLELTVEAGETLNGVLEMSGDRANLTIALHPEHPSLFDNAPEPAGVDKNGAFRIADLFPGRYRVEVGPLPGNSYIRELALDGMVTDAALDLSAGFHGSKLKVTVSPDGGEISGSVADPPARVFLIADPDRIHRENMVEAAPDGTWRIHGIRPGKYRLFAVAEQHVDPLIALRPLAVKAQEIEIKPGDRITQDLKLASPGDPDAN